MAATATVAALVVGGCGIGAGPGTKDASVQVTRDFGAQSIGSASEQHVPGSETVMSLLKDHFTVSTSDGGGFVNSIDGHAGSGHNDWFYYVNGILAPMGAAMTDVHKGDHVWWDLHDWSANNGVPAVVGSFPEPFTNGVAGHEYPTVLICANHIKKACGIVGSELRKFGIKAGLQAPGTGATDELAIVVGTWQEIQGTIAAELVGAGPKTSGVYAQFVGNRGQALELDNPQGDVARTIHGGTGLIAADEQQQAGEPAWMVTGDSPASVTAAARKLTPPDLRDHYAVVVHDGHVIPVPLQPGQ
jgi:hypothetical protein